MSKTDKELAYLHDLYVAPDWGERFAELIDEHVELPKKARALYVASGTGGHALKIVERIGEDASLIGVDESEEQSELARAKAAASKLGARAAFRAGQLEALDFEDDQFDLVIGDASMIAPERLPEMLAEMVRVAAHGATVALNLPTASSYGEFFSIYWEALAGAGREDDAPLVEELITRLPTIADVEQLAAREGLDDVRSWTQIEEFDFDTGEDFLASPLVRDFLMRGWLEPLGDEGAHEEVLGAVARLIDEERHDGDFSLSIKATLVVGQK
ncbi:MAG: methyltransferase domain-containing protein, partial [Acidobacteriota bacterium]|nr:methyltransferase domain-containing protein [Acidobacteriota bacterium]